MAERTAPSDVGTVESLEPMAPRAGRGSTLPMPAVAPAGRKTPTYHPTQWALVNRALDVADVVTRGRADWVQRFVTYAFIGGSAAVINLAIFALMYRVALAPLDHGEAWQRAMRWLISFVVASELSIFANFIPNDYFTFRHLPGHKRSWLARAARFNLTCLAGTMLTFVISGALHFLSVEATLGQAIAIALVFLFNFTFHHVYTYRHKHDHPN
jgi:putative flippase GtrA